MERVRCIGSHHRGLVSRNGGIFCHERGGAHYWGWYFYCLGRHRIPFSIVFRPYLGCLLSVIIFIIITIIMKSSFDRDNIYCHYVIQRIAGIAITLL
jgi:hypothetical protein